MIREDLNEGWMLTAAGGEIPPSLAPTLSAGLAALVPGTSHTVLLDAGLIPDPYRDANEVALQWMFDVDWRFSRLLRLAHADSEERVEIVFEGLDTVAEIRIDGELLEQTRNMHRSYRVDVTRFADGREHVLTVDLLSATAYAESERERLGERPSTYPTPFNYMRKMACSFGWDWGPDLRTAGIWRPVRVERWSPARLAAVRPIVRVDGATGMVDLQVDIVGGTDAPLTLTARVGDGSASSVTVTGAETARLSVAVPDARLWWPAGYGEQPLYPVEVALVDQAGESLDTWRHRVGFRSIQLHTSDDEWGTSFRLDVNGTAVFVKGVNWIPDEHFLTRITRDRLAARLTQAREANANLIRVWGGGIYESDDFYDLCDELGLLVWQDFLLACAAYAEEEPLRSEIAAEARENVERLMPHPSLALWNGGNENLWGHEDWGWKQILQGRTWGQEYALNTFRDIVADIDPLRPYTENSPSSPNRTADQMHPNDPDHGSHHQWDVWNRVDYTAYRDEIPRFCSEFGFQAPPTWRTTADWIHADDGGPLWEAEFPRRQRAWLTHQKAEDGDGKLDRGMALHLGVPTDFADWHWSAQLNQARAVRYAIDHYRSWWPRTAGSIVWQLNDCWPVTSWSAVDYEGRPKPLWFALRDAYAPRSVVFVQRDGGTSVALINDSTESWGGTLHVRRQDVGGEETLDGHASPDDAQLQVHVDVPARSVKIVLLVDAVAATKSPRREVLVARFGGERAIHAFVEDGAIDVPPRPWTAATRRVASGWEVRITAQALVRGLTVLADRVDPGATVDRALLDVLPGETAVFTVRTSSDIDPDLLISPSVLRCATELRITIPEEALTA